MTLVDRLGGFGGGERLAMEITRRLDPSRFERTLCISRGDAEESARTEAVAALERAGVRLLELERRSTFDVRAWRPLVSLLRRERIDVLHAHKFGSNVWGTVLGRLARVPIVVAHEHTWSYQGRPLRRFLDRELIARGTDAFVAVSREDRRRMVEVEGIDPADVVFVPNGIAPLPAPRGDVRAELGIAPGAPVIGAVAVLRPQKAIDLLVQAAARLVPSFPDLRVIVAGDGDERWPIERLAGELGVAERVTLLGLRDDVPDVLAALDVAVCCSRFEGSPLAVMEYMAAGKPVVGTRVGGVPDLIDSGTHGLLVPPGDPDALALAIGRLLRDPEAARRMGELGRERQRREFDLDATARRVERLYTELLDRPGAGRRGNRRLGRLAGPAIRRVRAEAQARGRALLLAGRNRPGRAGSAQGP